MSASNGRRGGAGSALLGLIAVSVIAGVMVTVGVAPAIALTGVAATNSIGLFENLPSDLKIAALQQKTEIYANSHGKKVQIAAFYNQNREVVNWNDISQTVKNATIAGEDVRFYQHGGVDPMGIVRAIVADLHHSDAQGASTITQQYVKNVCVQKAELLSTNAAVQKAYDDCTQPNVGRKVREMRLAIGLEKKYTKNQILLGYLNIALFGGNIYGIETAAQYYYGVHANKLTAAQAASLIAIVNNPTKFQLDQKTNIPANTDRRNHILLVELQQKMLTQAEYDAAIATKVTPKITPTQSGCQGAGASGFFCDYVVNVIRNSPEFGATQAIRDQNLQSAGWKIYTTLNLDLEKKAQGVMNTYVPKKTSVGNIGGAAVTVQVGTGRVLSMVQNKTYNNDGGLGEQYTAVNYSTDKAYGGSSGFQPGSTFKVFTLLDWLKSGHGLNDVVNANGRTMQPSEFTYCKSTYTGQPWTFVNDAGDPGGYQTVRYGTALSINGVFASMASKLDLCDIRTTAEDFGVQPATGGRMDAYPPFVIGQASTFSPLTMVTAYAGLANNGKTCSPVAIDKVVKYDGSTLAVPKTTCKQSIDKQVAIAAVNGLHGVITGGTMATDQTPDGKFLFGKTGTTDNAKDTWAIGASSKVATAVWVGNVDQNVNLRAVYSFPYCPVQSSTQAAIERHCVWKGIMTAANGIYGGATSWAQPESQYIVGKQTTVPNVAGMSIADAKTALGAAGFDSTVGKTIASDVPKGEVASTDPAGGSSTTAGSLVTINPSSGTPAVQMANVPNVVGQQLANAQTQLRSAGFNNVQVQYTIGNGSCTVTQQNPQGGQSPTNGVVQLTVAGTANPANGFKCTQ